MSHLKTLGLAIGISLLLAYGLTSAIAWLCMLAAVLLSPQPSLQAVTASLSYVSIYAMYARHAPAYVTEYLSQTFGDPTARPVTDLVGWTLLGGLVGAVLVLRSLRGARRRREQPTPDAAPAPAGAARQRWMLTGVLVALLALAALSWLTTGRERRGADPSDLLLGFETGGGLVPSWWKVDIQESGGCLVQTASSGEPGEAVGTFSTSLTPSQLRPVREAVALLRRAHLRADYPLRKEEYDAGYCGLSFLTGNGTMRSVRYPYYRPPRAIAALCDNSFDKALLTENSPLMAGAKSAAVAHPVAAVVLSVAADKRLPRAGEPITVTFTLRSVGTSAIAVASPQCRELVAGAVRVWAGRYLAPGEQSTGVAEEADGSLTDTMQVGGDMRLLAEPARSLTPQATADLKHLIVLGPGQRVAFRFPRPLRVAQGGHYILGCEYRTHPGAQSELIEKNLGAPPFDGAVHAQAPLNVTRTRRQ